MAHNENDNRPQRENLMQAAKMIYDRMEEAGALARLEMEEGEPVTVERIAESLANDILPKFGHVARGYTAKH